MTPIILEPIEFRWDYFRASKILQQLSNNPSEKSLNTLIEKSSNLVGNSVVEALAKHLRFSSTSTPRSWEVMEIDPNDKLSLLPHIVLDCICMQLPPKDRMRLSLVNRTLFTHVQGDRLWKEEGSPEAVQYFCRLIQTIEENLVAAQGLGEESKSKYPRLKTRSTRLLQVERLKTMLYLASPESLLPLFGKVDQAYQEARTLRNHPKDFAPLLHRVSVHSLDYGTGDEIQKTNTEIMSILLLFGISRKAVPVFCDSVRMLFHSNRLSDPIAKRIIYCIRQDFPDLDLTTMIPLEFFIQNQMIAQPPIVD